MNILLLVRNKMFSRFFFRAIQKQRNLVAATKGSVLPLAVLTVVFVHREERKAASYNADIYIFNFLCFQN